MTRSTLSARLDALRPQTRFHHAMSGADYEAHLAQIREHLKGQVMAAMGFAQEQGLSADEAIDITTAVAADLARGMYGSAYMQAVAQAVIGRGGKAHGTESEPR